MDIKEYKESIEDVKNLINEEKVSVNQETLNSSLMLSVTLDQLENVKYFLKNGADLSFKNHDPLATAVINNNIEIASYLLSKGDNPNVIKGKKNLIYFCINKDNVEMTKLLIESGFDIKSHISDLLGEVTFNGKNKMLEFFLSLDIPWKKESDKMIANSVQSGCLHTTELLLSKGVRLSAKANELIDQAIAMNKVKTLQLFWDYQMKQVEIESKIEKSNNIELKFWLKNIILKDNLQQTLQEKNSQSKPKI